VAPAAPSTEAIPDRGTARAAAPLTEAIPDRGTARAAAPLTEAIPDRGVTRARAVAPPTEAIPERDVSRGGGRSRVADRSPEPTGPPSDGTGVVGNRAAMRAERQAREAERQAMESERRKAARRAGVSRAALRAADDRTDDDAPTRRGRTGVLLLATVVVALVVLGVYSFTAPEPEEAGSTSTPTQTPAPVSVPAPTGVLPPLSVEPLPPVAEVPGTPVRLPVTVLNATRVGGLAADAAAAFAAQGWETDGVGEYEGSEVAVTTVFVTAGDEQQRQSALQLMEAFPGVVGGPADRFFEVPDVADPGLVVVLTGEWRP
jgi:hypothetical protein